VVVAVVLLGGCASASLFKPYPLQMQPIKQQVEQRQYAKAQRALDKYRNDPDKILYLMERGRVAQLGSDRAASIEDFRQAIKAIEVNREKARFTLSGSLATGSALLLNDNAIPYQSDGYERVLLHQFQALNYLFSGDVEAALVEVRRANLEQSEALEAHAKEAAAAEEKGRQYLGQNRSFTDKFAAMNDVANRVKNSFQNAYTFYTSGVIYEIAGNANDAYIDYKKALEIFPGNPYVQRDVLRLASKLGMKDDLQHYQSRFGIKPESAQRGAGDVVVLFENGFVPAKVETGVPIFVGQHVQKIAFPIYLARWWAPTALTVSTGEGQSLGETRPIADVQAMAVKALQEELPLMLVRQILRVVAKRKMSERAGDAAGPLGQFAVDVFNIVSENADRRSWLTLPAHAQILRRSLPAGEYQLRLNNGGVLGTIKVKVVAGRQTVVRVVATGRTLHTESIVK
jgi:hypothetical protein